MVKDKYLVDFSIISGRDKFQKKMIEDFKKRNDVNEDVHDDTTYSSNVSKNLDLLMSSEVKKSRKRIVPFEFKEKKIEDNIHSDKNSHDDYGVVHDNSLSIQYAYQDKVRDNTDELKKQIDNKN